MYAYHIAANCHAVCMHSYTVWGGGGGGGEHRDHPLDPDCRSWLCHSNFHSDYIHFTIECSPHNSMVILSIKSLP